MLFIEDSIIKEKKRIEFMLEKYMQRLSFLSKGTLTEKHEGERIYYYLKYRDGKKIISRYIPSNEVEDVKAKVKERQHIEKMVQSLKEELKFANHALGVKE